MPNPKPVAVPQHLEELRRAFEEGRAAFDRGEWIEMTPDELMDGIEKELGLDDPSHDGQRRERFEQGREAIARGLYSEEAPADLMARVRARAESDK